MTHDPLVDPGARLEVALRRLPQGIEPDRDLWSRIESRLEPRVTEPARAPRRHGWRWQAAAAVLLVAAASLLTALLVRRDAAPQVAQEPAMPARSVGEARAFPAAFGPTHVLSPEYDTARRQLAAMLQQRIGRMPAPARRKLEDNLVELQHAASEINSALAEQPGDPLLEELLLNTYQQELSVLAAANQLTVAADSVSPSDSARMQL